MTAPAKKEPRCLVARRSPCAPGWWWVTRPESDEEGRAAWSGTLDELSAMAKVLGYDGVEVRP